MTPGELHAFRKSELKHPIFSDPDWPYFVLRGFIDGDLDAMQTSKLMLFQRTQQEGVVYQIVDRDGQIDPWVEEFLRPLDVSREERIRIQAALHALPPEETQVFILPVADLLSEEGHRKKVFLKDIYNLFLHDLKKSLFLLIDKEENKIRYIVIPPRLYQEILKAKFPKTAMMPKPIFGHAIPERLSDCEGRVQAIPCVSIAQPDLIHGIVDTTDPLAVYYHDQHHLWVESGNPDRRLWTNLALSFQPTDRDLMIILLDRNVPLYSHPQLHLQAAGREGLDPEEVFWYNLTFQSYFENGIWEGEVGERRMLAILQYLKDHKALDRLEEFAAKEPADHPFSLKPWVELAKQHELI